MTNCARYIKLSFFLAICFALRLMPGNAEETVLSFTGNDSYVFIGTPDVLQIPSNDPFTVEGWMYLNALSSRDMLYCKNNARGSPHTYMLGFRDNLLAAYDGSDWQGDFDLSHETGQWYHLAFSFNGTTMSFYFNGALAGSAAFSFANNTAHTVKIGGYTSSSDINGMMSDVRVWDHARSQEEIQDNMNRRLFGDEPGLLAYWRLDEGEGATAYDNTATGSDGNIINASWVVDTNLNLESFITADPVTGSIRFTNTNKLDVVRFPGLPGYNEYQITEGGALPVDGAWISTNTLPDTVEFTKPGSDTEVLLTAWLTNSPPASVELQGFESRMLFTTASPAPSVKATYTRGKAPGQDVVVYPWEIDTGSTGGTTGGEEIPVHSLHLRVESGPGADATPEEPFITVSATGTYQVTLTVTNAAGNAETSTTCDLTVEEIESNTFIWEGSINNDWFEPLNWDLMAVPFDGTEVIVNAGADILLSAPSAELASLEMNGGALVFTNWDTSLNASNIVIRSGAVMTTPPVEPNAITTNRVYIVCENLTVEAGGEINVDDKGYGGGLATYGSGPGAGTVAAGHGGRGGDDLPYYRGGPVYGDVASPIGPGSGGRGTHAYPLNRGGNGGGSVRIQASGHVAVDGLITADAGVNTSTHGCSGSGGAIWITCRTFGGTGGVVRAEGKNHDRGGGGGGRIAVHYDSGEQSALPVPDVVFSVRGGRALPESTMAKLDGDIGTLFFTDTQWLTPAIPHSGQLVFGNEPTELAFDTLTLTNAWLRFNDGLEQFSVAGDLVVDGASARLDIGGSGYYTDCGPCHPLNTATNSTAVHVGGNVSLTNGGAMFLYPSYAEVMPLDVNGAMLISSGSVFSPYCNPTNGMGVFTSCRNLVIFENGCIDVLGAGFSGGMASQGLGPGGARYGGGGYGGVGGAATSTRPGGPVYGDPEQPVFPGSGGGSWDARIENYGGYGGGFARFVVAEKFVLNGFIDASAGIAGPVYDSGGSGGGIYIETRSFSGSATGLLKADGGEKTYQGGGGGGGRIAVWYGDLKTETTPQHRIIVSETPPDTFLGSASVLAGTGFYENGEDGTIRFIEVLYPQGSFFSSF